ncbi:MAG TPA: cation diffusion facilitator family transporter [Candidatus Limnocylindria bacterium]|nr:cation diffusion facilitator family transporter [Candidatus Limnocylindria bacterium]
MSRHAKAPTDVQVVSTSLVVSISDVLLNLLVAFLTGSTVMLSQALQGMSDLITGGLLFLGVKRSKKEADLRYQFGYGREIFFWVLMGGIFMFMGTGGLSFYFGYQQLISPDPVRTITLAFAMLAFGFVTNLYALSLSIKRLHRVDAKLSWWRQLTHSSIVETKATLLIDFMGTTAAFLGLVALALYRLTNNAQFDGLGSMAIGGTMMVASLLLIKDVRDLIVGRSVDQEVADEIKRVTESVTGIRSVLDLRTMYLGSAKLLVIVEVHVEDGLETNQIEEVVDTVKSVVMDSVPQVHHIQVEIETPDDEFLTSTST